MTSWFRVKLPLASVHHERHVFSRCWANGFLGVSGVKAIASFCAYRADLEIALIYIAESGFIDKYRNNLLTRLWVDS